MRTHLYFGKYEGRVISWKVGHMTSEDSRMANYSKGGNLLTIYGICTHLPGLNEKMLDFEWEGKAHFYDYRRKFVKAKSEYLMYEEAPKNLPILTKEDILGWYKEESKYISGLYWVKDSCFPLYSNKVKLTDFMEKVWADPKTYLECF
jgi:hypothetical protein